MKMVCGTFNGTGAAVYICCGFVPDKVLVRNVESTNIEYICWNRKGHRSAEQGDGVRYGNASDMDATVLTAGNGLEPYDGGDLMTSSNQTSVTYGEGIFLVRDDKDYRQDSTYGYVSNPIDTWTLGSSTNRTGNFNDDVPASGSRIGEGSPILIQENITGTLKWDFIEAVTGGQGQSANEVTLHRSVSPCKSGKILFIGGMYDYAPLALGKTSPAGFIISDATTNVNDNIIYFEASLVD